MTNKASSEVQEKALKVAKATQKPGQTKEQTKLIAQGIEKGISEYKKQQSIKSRSRDKERKSQIKLKAKAQNAIDDEDVHTSIQTTAKLPWILLVLSWLSFSFYILFNGSKIF